MKFLGVVLVICSLSYFAFVKFSPLRRFEKKSQAELETDFSFTKSRLETYEHRGALPEGGGAELIALREDQKWCSIQLFRLKDHLDNFAHGAFLIGGVLLAISILIAKLTKNKFSKMINPEEGISISDAQAKEEYVDDWEFKRKMEDGFSTREEAIHWMSTDPLLTCDYCGEKLRSTFTGDRETLEFITYYKKVPPGAKDMRIILGSRWYGKAATELKCPGCDRVVKR